MEKSLEVMLEGTYERMMRYSRDVTNPITMLYYLGVILPILGLMIFPLIGAIMGGAVKWWHLALVYNIILPLFYNLSSCLSMILTQVLVRSFNCTFM